MTEPSAFRETWYIIAGAGFGFWTGLSVPIQFRRITYIVSGLTSAASLLLLGTAEKDEEGRYKEYFVPWFCFGFGFGVLSVASLLYVAELYFTPSAHPYIACGMGAIFSHFFLWPFYKNIFLKNRQVE